MFLTRAPRVMVRKIGKNMSDIQLPKSLGQLAYESFHHHQPDCPVKIDPWEENGEGYKEMWQHTARIIAQECAQIADAYTAIADIADIPADPRKAQKAAARSISAAILQRAYS